MSGLKDLEYVIKTETILNIATQLSSDELLEVREHLKAKRESLRVTLSKAVTSDEINLVNSELSIINNLISKVNKANNLAQANAKELRVAAKQPKKSLPEYFLEIAEYTLHPSAFQEIRDKAQEKCNSQPK